MREAVVILAPHGRGQQNVLRCDRSAPGHVVLADVEPLRVLVEHRVDDVRERFVGMEEAMPSGEQIAFEPTEQRVLGEHLHDASVARKLAAVGVLRQQVGHPGLLETSYSDCKRFDAVSSGPNTRKFVMLLRMTSRRNAPSGLVFSWRIAPAFGTFTA